jgi:hypothetical protein
VHVRSGKKMLQNSTIAPSGRIGDSKFSFEVDGRQQRADGSWYRGDSCNFNPDAKNLERPDAVIRHVVGAWAPERPMIGPETRICAFGSCFASHISAWLATSKFHVLTTEAGAAQKTYVVQFGEGLVNSYSLLQQFEWAFEGKVNEVPLWHGHKAEEYGYDEEVRKQTRDIFDRTDVFILTLGLAEVWYDAATGGVFWRAVPRDNYDAGRHKFRVTTVEENRANLRKIYDLIRAHRPAAKVIFTMSPIPLVATFRPVPCITANSASKAIMRAALDEFIREVLDEGYAYYWPSYEIVLDVFYQRWQPDRRHVQHEILDFVMTTFEQVWCHGTTPRLTLAQAWIRAKAADGSLPTKLPKMLESGSVDQVQKILVRLQERSETGKVFAIVQRLRELAESRPELKSLISTHSLAADSA